MDIIVGQPSVNNTKSRKEDEEVQFATTVQSAWDAGFRGLDHGHDGVWGTANTYAPERSETTNQAMALDFCSFSFGDKHLRL